MVYGGSQLGFALALAAAAGLTGFGVERATLDAAGGALETGAVLTGGAALAETTAVGVVAGGAVAEIVGGGAEDSAALLVAGG